MKNQALNYLNTLGKSGEVSMDGVLQVVALRVHPSDLLQHTTIIGELLNLEINSSIENLKRLLFLIISFETTLGHLIKIEK